MRPLASEHLLSLEPYVPGKWIANLIKLASNENAFGPSPLAIEAAKKALVEAHLYPSDQRYALKEKLCEFHRGFGLTPEQFVLGNGSTELITLLVRALVGPGESVLNAWPSFLMYHLGARVHGREELRVPLTPDLCYDIPAMGRVFERPEGKRVKLVFFANPNNPTGRYITAPELEMFFGQTPEDVIVVLDEAYVEYVSRTDYPNGLSWVQKRPRTVVLRTFSKAYGLAGLRIAYAVCDAQMASLLHRVREPFNVSNVAQAAAFAALDDRAHVARSVDSNTRELERVQKTLGVLGIKTTESVANFILAHFENAEKVCNQLIQKGIIVRPVPNYDLPNALRISIGRPEENEALFTALRSIDS